jgi:hypothetical protein
MSATLTDAFSLRATRRASSRVRTVGAEVESTVCATAISGSKRIIINDIDLFI